MQPAFFLQQVSWLHHNDTRLRTDISVSSYQWRIRT